MVSRRRLFRFASSLILDGTKFAVISDVLRLNRSGLQYLHVLTQFGTQIWLLLAVLRCSHSIALAQRTASKPANTAATKVRASHNDQFFVVQMKLQDCIN